MIQQALALHQAGRIGEAEALYRTILSEQPGQTVARQYLGVAAFQSGRLDEAEALIAEAVRQAPSNAEAHTHLGLVLEAQGRSREAVHCYDQALKRNADNAETHYNRGVSLLSLKDGEEAAKAFLQAIRIKPGFGLAHYNLGIALEGLGQVSESRAAYGQAVKLLPDHALAHFKLGAVSHLLEQSQKAVIHFERALALDPAMDKAHHNLGIALGALGEVDRALACFRRALDLDPTNAAAHDALIEMLEQANRSDDLPKAVAAVEAACPEHPRLALWQAMLKKRSGEFREVRDILEARGALPADYQYNAARAQLLGEACDHLGDPAAAFAYFRQANEQAAQTPEGRKVDPMRYRESLDRLAEWYAAHDPVRWPQSPPLDDRTDPVFLVGFPRSGTTLLDSILRSHPQVSVIEERPMLEAVRGRVESLAEGYPTALPGLTAEDIHGLRDLYFERVEQFREEAGVGPLIVDKMPLNLVEAGLICRLFPQARFILALRHPCDCVLSCFMQNFKQNDAMANFRQLEDAAVLYNKAFGLWRTYESLFHPNVFTLRYEDLVDDFEGTLRPLASFLDLPWTDDFKNFADTARKRSRVRTPSYDQVTQPIYRSASGRWTRYRSQMEPVLPLLSPWAEHFGYEC
ncbi:tetratricopeptide repeat-containing sulfotransferase family protein [Magnetospira thiophila]